MTGPRAVVIGIGNEFRGDDGIGPLVATEIENLGLADVLVTVCDGDPTEMLNVWGGADRVVVVDAVLCEHCRPGRVRRTTVDALRGVTTATSCHALGISDTLALGRVLGRLPAEFVVIAVEARCVDIGWGVSEAVAAAQPEMVRMVLAELARAGIGPDRQWGNVARECDLSAMTLHTGDNTR